jgi:tetratricopeptide (TPR) repeat protein
MAKDRALAPLPPRQLWQVPVFLLGVGAVVAVAFARPLWHTTDAARLDRDLAEIRRALATPQAPPETLLPLARDVLARCEWSYQRIGEAHYLLGSLCQRLAAAGGDSELWQQARHHLEQAEALGVPEDDQPVLTYRRGVVGFSTGAEPARVIDWLTRGLDVADDKVEAYKLLTQAYQRLPSPNLRAALAANQQLLDLPTANDAQLDPVRLLRGELLLRVQDHAEARKVLARIGPSAAPDIRARARQFLAQAFQAEGNWTEAAKLWEEALADRAHPPREPGKVKYALGLCYYQLQRWDDADRTWEAALLYDGDELQASALRLAELRLETAVKRATVPGLYEKALKPVAQPADYRNALIDLAEARAFVETGWRTFHEAQEHEPAYRLAVQYVRLAVPPAGLIAVGEAAEAWARALRDEARRASDGEAGRRAEEAAQQRFREAGVAFAAVADAVAERDDPEKWLWRSGDGYWQGRDGPRDVAVLQRYVTLAAPQDRLGEAWYRLARAHDEAGNQAEQRDKAYVKCIEYPGPAAYEARYELALLQVARGQLDSAAEALEQNLQGLQGKTTVPAYERSLFTVGELLFRKGNYQVAGKRLQDALTQFPGATQAPSARLYLAESYRRLGDQERQNLSSADSQHEEMREHYRTESRRWFEQAAVEFQKVQDSLGTKGSRRPLSSAEDGLLRQARFGLAECRASLDQYPEAIRVYQELAERYKGQVEEVLALKGQHLCYAQLGQADNARQTLLLAAPLLDRLGENAFQGRPVSESWSVLQTWLKNSQVPLQPAGQPQPDPVRR